MCFCEWNWREFSEMSAELETADEACVFEQILDYLLKGAYPSNASKGQKLVIILDVVQRTSKLYKDHYIMSLTSKDLQPSR